MRAIEMIRFAIPGEPVPWSRAASNGKQRYTPLKMRDYKAQLGWIAKQAMAGREPYAHHVPLSLRLEVTLGIPRGWSQRKRAAAVMGTVRPTKRPDMDNFLKASLDGCIGIVFADDSSVVRIEASKTYGTSPGMTIEVIPLPVEGA